MLSNFVRWQLRFLALGSVFGVVVLCVYFVRVPALLGIGRYDVTANFATGGGIYQGAQVTYRGAPVGTVSHMYVAPHGIDVELSLETGTKVPANVRAEVHSTSAVGEQYVDLVPSASESASGTLSGGSVIAMDRTSVPVEIGPVLDDVQKLVASVPPADLQRLIQETSTAVNGRAGDIGSLLDNSTSLVDAAQANLGSTVSLLDGAQPLLGAINASSGNITLLTANLATATAALKAGDQDLRTLLSVGGPFALETSAFLDELKGPLLGALPPTQSVASMLATYNGNLANVLSNYPRLVAALQAVQLPYTATNELHLSVAGFNNPPGCTQGFVPASQQAPPMSQVRGVTPLAWCQAPSSSPLAVRGARNIPCETNPSRREALAKDCGQ